LNTDISLIKAGIFRIDSHQHFWQLSRGDYAWLTPEIGDLYKDFLPKQLAPELIKSNVAQTVLIQAEESEDEIYYMLSIAELIEFVVGVVGWVDMSAPGVIDKLKHYSESKYFKGIRPMLQDMSDVNWILREEFTPVFQFMVDSSLTFDALIKDVHLSNIQILAKRHPKLKIVIDHCAKPNLYNTPSNFWKERITNVAACNNVYIKLSGLLTEAPQGKVNVEIIQPYFEHLIQAFGIDRIMWGSDWPVVKLNGDYEGWISLTQSLLKNYSFNDKRKVWAENARQFYSLPLFIK
jgi:L-fuconolactonase